MYAFTDLFLTHPYFIANQPLIQIETLIVVLLFIGKLLYIVYDGLFRRNIRAFF